MSRFQSYFLSICSCALLTNCTVDPDDQTVELKGKDSQAVHTVTGADHTLFTAYRLTEAHRVVQWALSAGRSIPGEVSIDGRCQVVQISEAQDFLQRVIALRPKLVISKKKNKKSGELEKRVKKYSCRTRSSLGQTDVLATEIYELKYAWKDQAIAQKSIENMAALKKLIRGEQGTANRAVTQSDLEESYKTHYRKLLEQRELQYISYSSENYQASFRPDDKIGFKRSSSDVSEDRKLFAIRRQNLYREGESLFTVDYVVRSEVAQRLTDETSYIKEAYSKNMTLSADFHMNPVSGVVTEASSFAAEVDLPNYSRSVRSVSKKWKEFDVNNYMSLSLVNLTPVQFSLPEREKSGRVKGCVSIAGTFDLFFKNADRDMSIRGKVTSTSLLEKGARGDMVHLKSGTSAAWTQCNSRIESSHSEMPYGLILGRKGL